MYKYINNKDEVVHEDKEFHLRCKKCQEENPDKFGKRKICEKCGPIKKCKSIPTGELYENDTPVSLPFDGLKKKHKSLTKKDKENGVENFNIINNDQVRTYNKSTWE